MFWVASGLYFAIAPFDEVTGDHNKARPIAVNFAFTELVSPQRPIAELVEVYGPSLQVRSVSLRQLLGHEYRRGALPVWQVSFNDPENTRVYVAAETGVLVFKELEWRCLYVIRYW